MWRIFRFTRHATLSIRCSLGFLFVRRTWSDLQAGAATLPRVSVPPLRCKAVRVAVTDTVIAVNAACSCSCTQTCFVSHVWAKKKNYAHSFPCSSSTLSEDKPFNLFFEVLRFLCIFNTACQPVGLICCGLKMLQRSRQQQNWKVETTPVILDTFISVGTCCMKQFTLSPGHYRALQALVAQATLMYMSHLTMGGPGGRKQAFLRRMKIYFIAYILFLWPVWDVICHLVPDNINLSSFRAELV